MDFIFSAFTALLGVIGGLATALVGFIGMVLGLPR